MSSPSSRGRPRDPQVDAAILSAAAELIATQGYARMSISSVAKAAGVSKPTIYRRFATKADLATAALVQRIDETARPPAALDVETALTRALEHLAQRLRTRNSMALVGTLLVEEDQTPELIALFRERVWTLRTELLREILERGQAREEIRNDVDAAVLVGMLIGALYAVHLGQGKIPRGWPARVVSTALEGARKPNASQ